MSYIDAIHETRSEPREPCRAVPEATRGFAALSKAVRDNGPLSAREKEYIAPGMALALRCPPCTSFPVEALMKTGATRAELGDALAMAIRMGGGPTLMYAGAAPACRDGLAAKARA